MAHAHDRLGWRSFLEGRISKVLVQEMHNHLQNSTTRYTATYWACEFSSRLILITHHQWGYHNSHLHYRVKENKTSQGHIKVMHRTRELMRLDSSTLLPQFRDLLDAEDYDTLFEGSITNRQYWIYEVEAALAAMAISQATRKRKRRHLSQPHTTPPLPAPLLLNAVTNNSPLHYNMPLQTRTNVRNNPASCSSSPQFPHLTDPSHLLTLLLA
jgi:hypothetical protein